MTDAPDYAAVYRETRERICELVRDLDEGQLATPVPGCPKWTVKNVVSHSTGVCADIIGGKLEGVASDPWTQAQVDARRDKTIAEILEEWSDVGPKVEATLGAFPAGAAAQMIFDLVTHEHDLRGALRAPGARDSAAVDVGVEFAVRGVQSNLGDRPPLRVVAGDHSWGEEGGASLVGEPYDILRACSGRRSAEQIKALKWEGDPDAYLPAFSYGPFSVPTEPVED